MAAEQLSDRAARLAKVASGYKFFADGRNLYLKVNASGSKSWVFRYRSGRKQTDLGLGPYPDVTLADAREKALALRRQRLDGRDPITERRANRQQAALERARTITFRQATQQYYAAHRDGWRSALHAQVWLQSMRDYTWPVIGDLPVQAVDTGLILRALRPVWSERTETAKRVRGRIEAVLDYAASLGYRQGDNPARWKGHLEHSLAKPSRVAPVEHFAALPYAELPAFMPTIQNSIPGYALRFLILTAARAGEVIGATWDEIDLAERTWTIPAARMKASRDHRVPLSDAAMAIVQEMAGIRCNEYVFPGQRGHLSRSTFGDMLRRMHRRDITVHGFRSTFSQWAAERTNYQFEVRELALAHNVGSAVERAYQRSDLFDRRRKLMDDWAKFCAQPATGDVVPLRAGTA
jgi:integrase